MFRKYGPAAVGISLGPAILIASWTWTMPALERIEGDPGWRMTFVDPWIPQLCYGVASVPMLVLLAIPNRRRRRWIPGRAACAVGLVATLIFCLVDVVGRWATWWIEHEQDGPDGRRYALLTLRFAGGHSEALAIETPAGMFRTRCSALYDVDVDGVYWYGAMIRPASSNPRSLVFSDDGRVADVSHGLCAWVYDRRTGRGVAGEALPKLSPFLFLDAEAPGDETDLTAVIEHVVNPYKSFDSPGNVPTDAALLAAFDSPNGWIRAATRRIIEAGGPKMYPEATKRLATAPK